MNRLPRITLCPAGTPQVASARLRCHVLGRELARLGCEVRVGLEPGAMLPEVLYVQKRVTPALLLAARAVRATGGKVVYDIDDWGDALGDLCGDEATFAAFIAECDAVSVDTDTRRDIFAQDPRFAGVPFWVVPDPMDYLDGAPAPAAARDAAGQPVLGAWFGNGPNVRPAVPYIQAAVATGRLGAFSVITNASLVPQLSAAWPALNVEAWALDTFAARLRDHDFCLLIHDTDTEGVQKSNNKMLAALGQGVVPLVSNTPAYAETAQRIGIPELIIDSPDDLAAKLQPGVLAALRERLAGEACRHALRAYLPETVAQDFIEKLHALPARHADRPVRLNLGCGDMPLPGYINVDVAVERAGKQPDVCADVRDLSVFPDGYADEIMAIHVIEHFYRWEVVDLLKEWVRVLKPGGRLVLECPNLLAACEALLKNPEQAAGPGVEGNRTMWCFYGDPAWKDPLMCHRWLYTPQSLGQVMAEAGLGELRQEPAWFKAREPRDMRIVGVKPQPVKAAPAPVDATVPRVLFNEAEVTVVETERDGERVRDLWFGAQPRFRQSSFVPERPDWLVLPYVRALMGGLFFQPDPRHALVLGTGAGAVPRALKTLQGDRIAIDLVDIKQEVFQVAHRFFGLERLGDYRFFLTDAAHYVAQTQDRYDYIVVDLWDDEGVPEWLLAPAFWDHIARIARPGAVVCLNAPLALEAAVRERFGAVFPVHSIARHSNVTAYGQFPADGAGEGAAALPPARTQALGAMGVPVQALLDEIQRQQDVAVAA